MTTTRKAIIAGTALVLAVLLVGGGAFFIGNRATSRSAEEALSISADGTRIVAESTDEAEEASTSATSTDDEGASSGTTEQSSTGTSQNDPGAIDRPAEPAVEAAQPSASESAPSSGSESTGSGPGFGLSPDALARLNLDLVGPAIGAVECKALNFFQVYITDASGVASASVKYTDGPVITRTTALTKLAYHGDGNYYTGFLLHTSPVPLGKFVVTATDVRGNTTTKSVLATCP